MRFGSHARFLVDFFHVRDYLADAAKTCAPADPRTWLERQKERLKTNRSAAVLADLQGALDPASLPDETAPVRVCHRYLSHRLDYLDYQSALAQGLPIGSGKIESAHRYVLQQRLQRPGAWWTPDNAEAMRALHITRVNRQWAAYCAGCHQASGLTGPATTSVWIAPHKEILKRAATFVETKRRRKREDGRGGLLDSPASRSFGGDYPRIGCGHHQFGTIVASTEAVDGAAVSLEPGLYFPRFGTKLDNQVVRLTATGALPLTLGYRIPRGGALSYTKTSCHPINIADSG